MRKLINFVSATVLFGLVLYISLQVYMYVTGQKIEDNAVLSVIDTVQKIACYVAVSCYVWIFGCMVRDYAKPPLPLNEICETEMGYTVIERNQEGKEINRTNHTVKIYHTIPEHMIDEIMERWRSLNVSDNSEVKDNSQALCDYINIRTPYYATVTKNELLDRLRNK